MGFLQYFNSPKNLGLAIQNRPREYSASDFKRKNHRSGCHVRDMGSCSCLGGIIVLYVHIGAIFGSADIQSSNDKKKTVDHNSFEGFRILHC